MLHPSLILTAGLASLAVGSASTVSESSLSNITVATYTSPDSTSTSPRLSIKPKEAATGTKTEAAGTKELTGFPGYYLHVPESCVGNKRCPLVLLLHGGGRSGQDEVDKFRVLADKYGMIMLTGNATDPGRWDVIGGFMNGRSKYSRTERGITVTEFPETDVRVLDSALKVVLKTNAIDPDKIALLGFSDGGSYSLFLGRSNLDVFSRIAGLSALIPFDGDGPKNPNTQFFLSGGIDERGMIVQVMKLGQVLRKDGHSVVVQVGLRDHVDHVEDEDFIWGWLKDSWADPSVTTRLATIKADPLITDDGLARLTAFWTEFQKLPDSIQNVGRLANQMSVPLQLSTERVSVVLMNLPAMAAKYTAVAEALKTAGISAEDAQAYRTAIIAVRHARRAGLVTGGQAVNAGIGKSIPLEPAPAESVLAKNAVFYEANLPKLEILAKTGFLTLQ